MVTSLLLLLFKLFLGTTPFQQQQQSSLSLSPLSSSSLTRRRSTNVPTNNAETTTMETPWFGRTNDQVWETRQVPNIHTGMRMHRLPRTDILISEVGLGTMNFGQQVDQEEAYAQLDLAYNKYGINFIDTHELFPGPYMADTMFRSERIIGRWMHDRGIDRSSVVLCSKLEGYGWDNSHININNPNEPMVPALVENGFAQAQPAPPYFQQHYQQQHEQKQAARLHKYQKELEKKRHYQYRTSKEILQQQQRNFIARVNAQCQRLGTDYLDLLLISSEKDNNNNYNMNNYEAYINNMNEAWNLESTVNLLETLSLLIKLGKIRHYGLVHNSYLSTVNIITTAQLLSLPKPVLTAVNYNLLERFEVERGGVMELCLPRPPKHPRQEEVKQQQQHQAELTKEQEQQQQQEQENDDDNEDLSFNMGFMPTSPLAGGALSGKYHVNNNEDKDLTMVAQEAAFVAQKQARHFRINKFPGTWMGRYLTSSAREATAKYLRLVEKYSLPSLAAIALPFVSSRPFTSTTLMSATSVSQLEDNILQCCNIWMTEQLLEDINKIHQRNTEPTQGVIHYERHYSPSEFLGLKKNNNSRKEIEEDIDLDIAGDVNPVYLPWGSRVSDFDPGHDDNNNNNNDGEESEERKNKDVLMGLHDEDDMGDAGGKKRRKKATKAAATSGGKKRGRPSSKNAAAVDAASDDDVAVGVKKEDVVAGVDVDVDLLNALDMGFSEDVEEDNNNDNDDDENNNKEESNEGSLDVSVED